MLTVRLAAEDPGSGALIAFADIAPDDTRDLTGAARRVLHIRPGADRLAGALAISKLLREPRVVADLRGIPPKQAAQFLEGACLRAWHTGHLRTRPDDTAPRLHTLTAWSDAPGLDKP